MLISNGSDLHTRSRTAELIIELDMISFNKIMEFLPI